MAEQDFLSIQDVARRMGVHQKTVRAYIASGQLKAKKLGRLYKISVKDYEEFSGAELVGNGEAHQPAPETSPIRVQPERKPTHRAELRRIRSELDRFLDELEDELILDERRTG